MVRCKLSLLRSSIPLPHGMVFAKRDTVSDEFVRKTNVLGRVFVQQV